MWNSWRLKAYNLGKRYEPDMNTNTTVEAHGAGRPSTHTRLHTTGIFQLSWERTRLKCFNKMETVRKIFMSGISQQCCLTSSPCGMMKEPSQADPPHSLACPHWAPARLPWAMDCQGNTWARRASSERAPGAAEAPGWDRGMGLGPAESRLQTGIPGRSSWKWQEGTSSCEGGGKRKGKAYKEMEVFTGTGTNYKEESFFLLICLQS